VKKTELAEFTNIDQPETVDIVYKAAHDLKGPLRTIKSFAQLLDNSMSDRFTQDEKGLVGFIMEATENLENLIVKMIDFSKAGLPLNISEFKIDNLLQMLVLKNAKLIEEKNASVIILCDESLMMRADKNKLNILLENLISNSLKFVSKSNPPEIKIKVAEDENNVNFSVLDNGIGIDEHKLTIAFELFERVHTTTDYKGTRTSLATCKRIVEMQGGSIRIQSELGKYTEVNFTIPKRTELY